MLRVQRVQTHLPAGWPSRVADEPQNAPAAWAEVYGPEWYINVHTQDHQASEIRGQVLPPKS